MLINLNALSNVVFCNDDVLSDNNKKKIRTSYLRRAMILGNLYKRRVKLFFKTVNGQIKSIEATVWAVGDEYVSLRAGKAIPVKSILSVEF